MRKREAQSKNLSTLALDIDFWIRREREAEKATSFNVGTTGRGNGNLWVHRMASWRARLEAERPPSKAGAETEVRNNGCKEFNRASLVAQWLRICLPMQGTRVRVLVWEDPTCRGATRPVSHNYWACASGACASQQERPRQWKAHAPRWRVAPACHN